MKNILLIIVLINATILFNACEPKQEDAIELSEVPSNVTFSISEKQGEVNTYVLTNTTAGTFLHQWDLGNGDTATGAEVEVYYPFQGEYTVRLKAFNDGGFGEGTNTVSVAEDDAAPCAPGSLVEFFSSCEEQTWVLLPEAGAYWVGPVDNSMTWWSNGQSDVDARPCAFNDEWTFTVNGEVIYDTKGDLWAEDYMGFNFECVADDQLADNVAPWASNSYTYATVEGDIEQLSLNGLGAFLGLPKATNNGEVTEPVNAITYDIIDKGENADGKYFEVEVNFGGGLWRFKYVTKE